MYRDHAVALGLPAARAECGVEHLQVLDEHLADVRVAVQRGRLLRRAGEEKDVHVGERGAREGRAGPRETSADARSAILWESDMCAARLVLSPARWRSTRAYKEGL